MAHTIGNNGIGVLLGLGKLVLTLYGALIVFVFLVLGAVALIARIPLARFVRAVREPFVLCVLHRVERGCASHCAGEHGTDGRARAYRRVRAADGLQLQPGRQHAVPVDGLGFRRASRWHPDAASQQLLMMLTLMLTSKGVAAVPRASLVILAGTLATFRPAASGRRADPGGPMP